ncbi:unnamed protein product [Cyprideis torosa]|uniref:Uncharacterized protein n=1 Tax=Cyprideis torosa TaxID=163714 RepID=A0A7R8W2V4_9CRUS|nr:unnamed protein product [Cyprideis torosa]CAG0882346.1 unnamed protein product [Cyprideis torosa]
MVFQCGVRQEDPRWNMRYTSTPRQLPRMGSSEPEGAHAVKSTVGRGPRMPNILPTPPSLPLKPIPASLADPGGGPGPPVSYLGSSPQSHKRSHAAAAAFFLRASLRMNLPSPRARRVHPSGHDVLPDPLVVPALFSPAMASPSHGPPLPAVLLRQLGRKEPGIGKVRVLLRIQDSCPSSTILLDRKRKQITLDDPTTSKQKFTPEDRKLGIAAPKMFAFDGLFASGDPNVQEDICSSALSDIIAAVIGGSDGTVLSMGHSNRGDTMIGSPGNMGVMPLAISWLFQCIAEQRTKTGARFSVRVSVVEVGGPNEELRDLLLHYANDADQSPGALLSSGTPSASNDVSRQLLRQSEFRVSSAQKAAYYLDASLAARNPEGSNLLLFTLHVYQYSVVDGGHGRRGPGQAYQVVGVDFISSICEVEVEVLKQQLGTY